jgi:hypothetical protein
LFAKLEATELVLDDLHTRFGDCLALVQAKTSAVFAHAEEIVAADVVADDLDEQVAGVFNACLPETVVAEVTSGEGEALPLLQEVSAAVFEEAVVSQQVVAQEVSSAESAEEDIVEQVVCKLSLGPTGCLPGLEKVEVEKQLGTLGGLSCFNLIEYEAEFSDKDDSCELKPDAWLAVQLDFTTKRSRRGRKQLAAKQFAEVAAAEVLAVVKDKGKAMSKDELGSDEYKASLLNSAKSYELLLGRIAFLSQAADSAASRGWSEEADGFRVKATKLKALL